ncbi:MAG TPA: helix-turn-helix domain-containing protein [Rhodocyclaceae bacterium]|nr:helix-turn-helix domain-containing protein [Rhodocyclaceae bacterium]
MRRPSATLHVPSPVLGACVMAGVERDTRGCTLTDRERFNFYPASPMASISWIFEGALHLMEDDGGAGGASTLTGLGPALPRLILAGPHTRPTASWSPGSVHALMVGIYPEAMARLLGRPVAAWLNRTVPLADVAPPALLDACNAVFGAPDAPFAKLETTLRALWNLPAQGSPIPYLGDWVRGLATRATHSGAGCSLRQWQRRIRAWTGQSQRDLEVFVRIEEAFVRRIAAGPAPNLAMIAAASGYADQSHMGRDIKRVTGVAPARIGERMAADESFWYYRLIADAIAQQG